MKIRQFRQKLNILFLKHPPAIIFLTVLAALVGIDKLLAGLLSGYDLSLMPLNGQENVMNVSMLAFLEIMMGVLYLFIAKWIWQGEENGRSTLLFLSVIDVVFSMWAVSQLLSVAVRGQLNILSHSIYTVIHLLFYLYVIWLLNKESTRKYFRLRIK